MQIKPLITISLLILSFSCEDRNTPVSKVIDTGSAHRDDSHVIHAMGDHDYPPFEYNDNGIPSGFNIDILRSVAKVMNLNVDIKLGPWNEVRSKLENGEIDLLAGMFKTPERMKKVDFTIPHFISTYVIFVRTGSDIKSLDDIRGRVVLVQDGDLGHDYIKENGTAGRIITKSELGDVLASLSRGDGDCAIAAAMQGQIIIKKESIKNLTYIAKPLVQRGYCIGVKKGDAELLAKLNEGLNIIKSTGEYDSIYEKWFGIYEDRGFFSREYAMPLLYALIGVLLLLAGIYLWNLSLHKRIRDIETLFRSVFERSPYSISLNRIDNGRYFMVNRAFEQLTGYTSDEVQGKTAAELGIQILEVDFNEMKAKLDREKRIDNEGVMLKNRRGEERYCLFSVAYIKLRGEEYVVTMTVDVTETKILEQKYRQSQKMEVVGQLAGGVAHDFNNMLTGIIGGTELLLRNVEPGSKLARYADVILKGAERASELTTKLLAFSRMGKMVMKSVDVHEVILSAIELLERTIDRKIVIRSDLAAKNRFVKGDSSLLQNAFMNLGLNARDAMPEGGEILFATRGITVELAQSYEFPPELHPGEYIEVTVSDTGCGIPENISNRIFEPFFTTKPVGKGTGLGLSAVYGTVKEHGGLISVKNNTPSGSVFTLVFPAEGVVRESESAVKDEDIRFSGTVLVIDDEQLVRNILEGYLNEIGFTVITADNGKEGAEVYRSRAEEILFVVVDMVMPGINGMETLKLIREINSDVKVIFSSGFTRQGVLTGDPGGEELLFLQKPYRMNELITAVKSLMRQIDIS